MKARPSRLLRWVLAASSCCIVVVAAATYVGRERPPREHPSSSSPAAWRAPFRVAPPVSADLLPTLAMEECLARLPPSADFQAISDFATVDGELRVTWQLPEGPAPWADPEHAPPSTVVRLGLAADGIARALIFGAHVGQPYARELSACRRAQRGGPCAGYAPSPILQGVVSEFSIQQWTGYLAGGAVRWMLVRTPASVLLLKVTGMEGLHDADRGLCAGNGWRRLLEIIVAPTVTVREEVLVGDPPTTFDCARSYEEDSRCAG